MAKNRKKYNILKCKFTGSAKNRAKGSAENFYGLGNYPKEYFMQDCLSDDIYHSLDLLCTRHLDYDYIDAKSAKDFLNRGFDVVVEYFCGDWWKADKDAILMLDKSRANQKKDLQWYKQFSQGILLGMLSERWDEVKTICEWVEGKLAGEYLDDEFEIEIVDVYKSIAAFLSEKPMRGLKPMEERLRNCRYKRPKLLFEAWEAARESDQETFDQVFEKSLAHFSKNYGKGYAPLHWVALDQSVVALTAVHLGMTIPELPEKLEALVITPESLRL